MGKFLRIRFYDNDFSGIYQDILPILAEYLPTEKMLENPEYEKYYLVNLYSAIPKMVLSAYIIKNVEYELEHADFYAQHFSEEKVEPSMVDENHYLDYFSHIDIDIIECDLEELEWENYEVAIIPFNEHIEPFII